MLLLFLWGDYNGKNDKETSENYAMHIWRLCVLLDY